MLEEVLTPSPLQLVESARIALEIQQVKELPTQYSIVVCVYQHFRLSQLIPT